MLVISITPASAALMSEANTDNSRARNMQDDNNALNNSIDGDMYELKKETDSLKQDFEYIKNRAGDYNWKFWKWPKITSDIFGRLNNIQSTAEKTKESADKLKENTDKLKEQELPTTISTPDRTNRSYDSNDAQYMASELSERLNTPVTSKRVPASEVQKGDIIQYMSNGSYPRYLEVMEITSSENITEKQAKNEISTRAKDDFGTDDPYLIIMGTGTLLKLYHSDNYIKMDTNGKISPEVVLNCSTEVQIDKIRSDTEKVADLQESADDDYGTAKDLGIYAAISGAVSLLPAVFFALTAFAVMYAQPLIPVFATAGAISIKLDLILVPLTILLLIIAGKYYVTGNQKDNQANKLNTGIELDQNDLNSYSDTKKNNEINMTVSTYDGVPIIKQPPDWKSYESLYTPRAEHGDVIMGPNIQFLYGPHEGYTGEDRFKIYALKRGTKEPLRINVAVNVQPIPVLTIPTEGGK